MNSWFRLFDVTNNLQGLTVLINFVIKGILQRPNISTQSKIQPPSFVMATPWPSGNKGGSQKVVHVGSNFNNKVPNLDPEHILFRWIVLREVIWHFFGDLSQSKKLSDI